MRQPETLLETETMTDLEKLMRNSGTDAAYDMKTFDAETYRDKLREQADDGAENACIYHSHCMDIISRYESDDRASDAEEYTSQETYKAEDWTKAMNAYAFGIARAVMGAVAEEMATEAEEAADELAELATKEGAEDPEILVARECPYGWSSHNYETDSGAMVWRNIEGSRAVAIEAGGIWLHAIWTPETQDASPNT
jgi:hypothetical protein